jgi:hypothetical protein
LPLLYCCTLLPDHGNEPFSEAVSKDEFVIVERRRSKGKLKRKRKEKKRKEKKRKEKKRKEKKRKEKKRKEKKRKT